MEHYSHFKDGCGMSWFIVILPIVGIQVIVIYGILHFICYSGCCYGFTYVQQNDSSGVRITWGDILMVVLTVLLLITSVYTEVVTVLKDYTQTMSLFVCNNDDPSQQQQQQQQQQRWVRIFSSYQTLQASVCLIATLVSLYINQRLDALMEEKGSTTPRVLFRTWSGWNLKETTENPILELPT